MSEPTTCRACGKPFNQHLGVQALCAEYEVLKALLRRVHDQAGNGAPEHRRHALTPTLREEIEETVKGTDHA